MKKIIILLSICLLPVWAVAQKLKVNLDPAGQTYIKGGIRANFWARYYQTNPGSTMGGEAIREVADFSIRRLRINFQAQLTPKLFFYSNFGNNNINLVTQNTIRFDPLDLYFEYEFAREFALGMGEIGWGASRGAMRSSKSMMGLDTPLFSLFTINKNDDLARNLGAYAKGHIHKWTYIVAIKNPIKIKTEIQKYNQVDFAQNAVRKQYSGYLRYDFLDVESTKTSYSSGTGTYIGTQKIWNFALGGVFQSKMMMEKQSNEDKKFYDYKNIVAEMFLDLPISLRNDALTAYVGFFHTDFGREYVRNVGANDVADGSGGTSFNTNGNDFPMMGTGNTLFFQGGYLLPKFEKYSCRIQPNISIQHSKFHGLKDAVNVYDLGINIFFKGHDQKLTLSYQSRPIFNTNREYTSRKGMIILQYQIEVN